MFGITKFLTCVIKNAATMMTTASKKKGVTLMTTANKKKGITLMTGFIVSFLVAVGVMLIFLFLFPNVTRSVTKLACYGGTVLFTLFGALTNVTTVC